MDHTGKSEKSGHSLWLLLMIIALVAGLHLIGLRFLLYWQLPWYDRIVHPLAGFWISVVVAGFILARSNNYKRTYIFLACVLSAFIIGIFWELFELKAGITVAGSKGYRADTIGDIVSDLVGGCIAFWYLSRRRVAINTAS